MNAEMNHTEACGTSCCGGREFAKPAQSEGGKFYRPAVDIRELTDSLQVVTDLPGVAPENIEVNFENGRLTVQAKVEPRQPEGLGFLRREYGVGNFYRAFEVREKINVENIRADYTNGVLTLTLPKSDQARARKIAVQGN